MRLIMLAAVATLTLSASSAAQQPSTGAERAAQAETIRGAPPDAPFAPPRAVDHVVVMSVKSDPPRPGGDRVVVTRSGDWMRTDRAGDGRSVGYSNFATGISIAIARDRTGRLSYLNAARHAAGDTYHVYTRVRTGERDVQLGETCEIWRYALHDGDTSPIWLSCVARDGVELWSRTLYPNGEIMDSAQAIAVERRRVRAGEVRPPSDAFDWEAWTSGLAVTSNAPNDEVILTSSHGRPAVIRRRAGWTYRAGRGWMHFNPDIRRIELTHEAGGLFLRYDADSDGPLALSIERRPLEGEVFGPSVATGDVETVLGERCIWFGATFHFECRTSDGLLLWARMVGDRLPMRVEFKATHIRRGGVSKTDMQPPRQAFTWLK